MYPRLERSPIFINDSQNSQSRDQRENMLSNVITNHYRVLGRSQFVRVRPIIISEKGVEVVVIEFRDRFAFQIQDGVGFLLFVLFEDDAGLVVMFVLTVFSRAVRGRGLHRDASASDIEEEDKDENGTECFQKSLAFGNAIAFEPDKPPVYLG